MGPAGEARARRIGALVLALLVVAGCSARRIERGLYHSDKGYRVRIPGPAWEVVRESRGDLELRHESGAAGIVVNASCDPRLARRPLEILERQLLAGVSARRVLERGEVSLDGRVARRVLVEGTADPGLGAQRIEAYVLSDGRCVYDLIYAASPDRFGAWRDDFGALVWSFAAE